MRTSKDIRAGAEASVIGRNCVVVGEVRKTTTISLSTGMNSACASQIRLRSDLPFLRNALTDGHTDRQTDTPVLYIEIQREYKASI